MPTKTRSSKPKRLSILEQIKAKAAESDVIITPEPPAKTIAEEALVSLTPKSLEDRSNAYIRIGVTAEAVANFPDVTETVKTIGGTKAVMRYLRGSDTNEGRNFIRIWDECPHKDLVPIEAICVAAKLTRKQFMQLLMGEVCEQSDMESTLLAAAAHPEIVQKTIEMAKSNEFGGEARRIIHQNRGFLPSPKNQTVNILKGNLNQDNRQDNSKTVSIGELNVSGARIGRAVDRFNEQQKVISAGEDEVIDL